MSGFSSDAARPRAKTGALLTPEQRHLLWAIAGISIFTNLLMLTGPIFMLQVYDRVLSSRSEATLLVLLALVAFLYAMLGLLDHARTRIASRLGAQVQQRLQLPVFETALNRSQGHRGDPGDAVRAPQDLTFLQQLSGSQLFTALFDFPWVPLFIGVIAILHPLLGLAALGCALLLTVIGLVGHRSSRSASGTGQQAAQVADGLARQIATHSGTMRALGMQRNALKLWQKHRGQALQDNLKALEQSGPYTAMTRTLRLFLQSALLAAGAWLVLAGEITPGAMVAATIILGRALAPLDQIISGWPQLRAASAALRRLTATLQAVPQASAVAAPPDMRGPLRVDGLLMAAPGATTAGKAVLRDISFSVDPGQALGVIGPGGAGKSALAATLTSRLRPVSGEIRLNGTRLDQYPSETLDQIIGYIPQRLLLFEGSVHDNIARFDPCAREADVIAAARQAGAHDMIQSLPLGYATRISADGGGVSGGQAQQIAFARALFGNPALLVLDEPTTQLDEPAQRAVNTAIRKAKARGAIVIVIAHRPAALAECDLLLKLDQGRMTAFGDATVVLRDVTHNSPDFLRARMRPVQPAPAQTVPPQLYPWELRQNVHRP
ncbi:MAG: type I secretion system permease/ATPase [Roseinatronobacter sp.]